MQNLTEVSIQDDEIYVYAHEHMSPEEALVFADAIMSAVAELLVAHGYKPNGHHQSEGDVAADL
jgi:hypothetical protein